MLGKFSNLSRYKSIPVTSYIRSSLYINPLKSRRANILIVESENDQYFIEALVKEVLSSDTNVCKVDEYKHSSLDEKKLTIEITDSLTTANKNIFTKIGIILDMDNSTEKERIDLINKCLQNSFNECGYTKPHQLTRAKEFVDFQTNDGSAIQISCFFTNIDGQGELETVLKAIKTQDSTFADCIYTGWLECWQNKGKKYGSRGETCDISDKEVLKLWVDFYKRFDTLTRQDRNETNTDWRGIMTGLTKNEKKLKEARGIEIFDLNSQKLNDIKSFLKMFD